jgi:hypothetical protein
MDDIKQQTDIDTRREWMRQVVIGAAGLSAGMTVACSSAQKTPEDNSAKPIAAKGAGTGNMVQVICHGMMAFKLPGSGSNVMEIHIPLVKASAGMNDAHVYKAGAQPTQTNYMTSDLQSGAKYTLSVQYGSGHSAPKSLPTSLTSAPIVNLYSPNDKACQSTIPATGQIPFCTITIPIPDDYHGYLMGHNTNLSLPLFKGSDADHCSVPSGSGYNPLNSLKSTPLVHVFRYQAVAQVSLDTATPWTANGSDKLWIYAEPAVKMGTPSRDHLVQLENYLGIDLTYLDFYDLNLMTDPDPGDSDISPLDLVPLYGFKSANRFKSADYLKSTEFRTILGGSPADCISVYGS